MGFFSMVFPKMDGFPVGFPMVFPWFLSHQVDGFKPVVVDDEPLRQSDGMLQGLQWQQDTDRPGVDALGLR